METAVNWIQCFFHLPSDAFEECYASSFRNPFRLERSIF
uniref:Uncharacterized protein n=1 Tax=Rhizophora mucronata TaxID=61149 RepID=A0A2P2QQA2_RHIMU